MERTLLGVSAEVARSFVGKADEIAATSQRARRRDDAHPRPESSTLLAALSNKSQEFTAEVEPRHEQAVSAIEAKGFDFTRTMIDNSAEIARQINEAGENATGTVNETLAVCSDTAHDAIEQSQADGRRHGVGDDGDARYAAHRHHRAVRAPA